MAARQEDQRWVTRYFQQPNAHMGWGELQKVLAAAPTDEWTLKNAVIRALGLYVLTEQTHLWANILPQLRPHFRLAKRSWPYSYYVAHLRMRQGRWRSAYQAAIRAMAFYQKHQPNSTSAFRVHMYVHRALPALACGNLDMAKSDIEQATAIEAQFDRGFIDPYGLHLAQAELALAQERFRAALTALQEGMARAATAHHKPKPHNYIEYDLAAARIARAEGKMASFQHFAEQALNRCLEWELPLSEARVRAVMAGADR